jgi:hypothetical protein
VATFPDQVKLENGFSVEVPESFIVNPRVPDRLVALELKVRVKVKPSVAMLADAIDGAGI